MWQTVFVVLIFVVGALLAYRWHLDATTYRRANRLPDLSLLDSLLDETETPDAPKEASHVTVGDRHRPA